jgi:Tfp pilus assembly ATPase PilU
MQLLDEHLWQLYVTGKITMEEMLDKARQPGALQDKATARIKAATKVKRKAGSKELEDIGPILRT